MHASTRALEPRDFRGPQGEIFICMCGTWLVLPVRLMIDQGKCVRNSTPNEMLPSPLLALEAFYSINSGPWSVKTHKHTPHTHADTDHNLHSSAWHPMTSVMLWKTHTTFVLPQWSCRCPVCHRVPMFLMPIDKPLKSKLLWKYITCFLFFISLLKCFQGRWCECVCVWSCDECYGHLTLRLFVSNLHCVWIRCCCSARLVCPLYLRSLCH